MSQVLQFLCMKRVKYALFVLACTLSGIPALRYGSEFLMGIEYDLDSYGLQLGPALIGMAMMLWSIVGMTLFAIALRGGFDEHSDINTRSRISGFQKR